MAYIKMLTNIAHFGGDFQVMDPETSRSFEVTTVAGFAVTWWIDHPVCEIKIVDLRPITS